MRIEDLTRDERIDFLTNQVWKMIREVLFDKKQELYQGILDENTPVAKVKSKADKLAMIDELFEIEKEVIDSLSNKGE